MDYKDALLGYEMLQFLPCMRWDGFLVSRKLTSRNIGVVSAAVLSIVFLVLALLHPGVRSAEVDLNDGGVWVTSSQKGMVAHLNSHARSLDAGFLAETPRFNVFQNGEQVFFLDDDNDTLGAVDVARASKSTPIEYKNHTVAVGGQRVAFLEDTTGKVWIQNSQEIRPLGDDAPSMEDLGNSVIAVGFDGGVHAVSTDNDKVISILPSGELTTTKEYEFDGGLSEGADLQIAAIGDEAVVFDKANKQLFFPDGSSQDIEGEGLTLQESGPAADSVVLASKTELIEVPMGGGEPTVLSNEAANATGKATRPVRHMSCIYGAWSSGSDKAKGDGAFMRQCANSDEPERLPVPGLTNAEKALFRVNRDVIVLNDVDSGNVWLPDSQMFLVDNWDEVLNSLNAQNESEEDSPEESKETLQPERSEKNTPPEGIPDEFGVRAGRTNILPVLQNDIDVDGDFLTAKPLTQPSIGTVSVARDGGALQIDVPKEATGSSSFEYEVSDGRGGIAKTSVTLTVRSQDVNEAPKQFLISNVSVGVGNSMTVNALANWFDPDGDPIYLEKAEAPQGITLRSHVNGSLDIKESGHGPGKEKIVLFVSDGRDTGQGEMGLTIKDSGDEPPKANADHVVVRAGSSISFSPLANDTDPNGNALRLIKIDDSPKGITAVMDVNAGTVTIEGSTEGTFYLGYSITDGANTAKGFIRIDVVKSDESAPPSAEPDLGVLPEGSQVLIDLLANDTDPTGGVLTVQRIDVPENSPLLVALVNHQLVRVSAPRGLNAAETFTYTVTNGAGTATASVTVLPQSAQVGSEPPEVHDDRVIVRAGDVASIAVLANDRSAAGLKLTVDDKLAHEIPAELATVFLSDNVIRVRGGTRAGSSSLHYTVHDSAGNFSTAKVQLIVVEMNEKTNTAPRPRDLTVRTTAGSDVDITVPMDNIDPEGDSVTLVGIASAPKQGSVRVEGTKLVYTASDKAQGTDSFTYLVEDRLGKSATATIRVGISPRDSVNQNPVALPDQVLVRPGAKVSVAVLSNDIDPDGDKITMVKDSVKTQSTGLTPTERNGRIILVAPKEEGSSLVSYEISDGRAGKAQGILTVVVRNEAPEVAPIARDDFVTTEDLQKLQKNTVVVPVLKNDEDPDGDVDDVVISSPDANVVINDDKTVTVTVAEKPQLLVYTITDSSQKSASAIIRVPGFKIDRPTLDTTKVPIKMRAGESRELPINDFVIAREGRSVQLVSEAKVSAGIGHDGSSLVKNNKTLTFTAAEDFAGLTSVTMEVTDGSDVNDPEGVTALLTLPIEVQSKDNQLPIFTPTGITVVAGEKGEPVDLAQMVMDRDGESPSSMTYAITGSLPTDITAVVKGTILEVTPATTARKGLAGRIRVTVTDSHGGEGTGEIPVTVAASNRPLIQTSESQVTLNAGKDTTVNVLELATNPFPEREPVRIVGQPITGEGGTATVEGGSIRVSAAQNFSGSFVVSYTLGDATQDEARQVRGIITATVRDKPAPPKNVAAASNSAGTAEISWVSGSANGAPITGFTITDHTQGDTHECGLVTTCLFPNRKNGQEHTFSVTATNEVGVSDASNQATTMIDVEPEIPSAPTLTPGDRQLVVSWTPPHNDGSAITEYVVNLSPGGPRTVPASQTSLTFDGLENGLNYQVTVVARNQKGASQPSVPAAATPYGPPSEPQGLSAQYANLGQDSGSTGTVDVSWSAPANTGGRGIESYIVTVGDKTVTVPGHQLTASVGGVSVSAEQVTVSVVASSDVERKYNSAPASTQIWLFGKPQAPKITAVAATGEDRTVRLTYQNSPDGGGWRSTELSYEWSVDGGNWQSLSGSTVSGNGLSNGASSRIKIRAVGSKSGTAVYSNEALSTEVVPFGPPIAPAVNCRPGETGIVICNFTGGDGNGRPMRFEKTVTKNGGTFVESGPTDHSWEGWFDVGEGGTARTCVRTIQTSDELGERSAEQCAESASASYLRQFDGWRGDKQGNCQNSVCRKVMLSLWSWPPNSAVTCRLHSWGSHGAQTTTVQVGPNGAYEGQPNWNLGRLWTSKNSDVNEITCDGGTRVDTPDHYPDNQ